MTEMINKLVKTKSVKMGGRKEDKMFNKNMFALKDSDIHFFHMLRRGYQKDIHTSNDANVDTFITKPRSEGGRSIIINRWWSISVHDVEIVEGKARIAQFFTVWQWNMNETLLFSWISSRLKNA